MVLPFRQLGQDGKWKLATQPEENVYKTLTCKFCDGPMQWRDIGLTKDDGSPLWIAHNPDGTEHKCKTEGKAKRLPWQQPALAAPVSSIPDVRGGRESVLAQAIFELAQAVRELREEMRRGG